MGWFENENPDDQTLGRLYNSTESFWPSAENLEQVAKGKRVILTNRAFILSKSIHNVFPLPFDVFVNPIEMVSERGFPLLRRFNFMIMHMRDTGIIEKLYSDFYYNVTVLHYIRYRDGIEVDSVQVLTLGHMDGAFTVLILGLSISSLAFGVEIFVGTYSRRKRAKRLWKLLRNSWRKVSIMRSMQSNGKRNATKIHSKWNKPKKFTTRNKFNTSYDAFKSYNHTAFE